MEPFLYCKYRKRNMYYLEHNLSLWSAQFFENKNFIQGVKVEFGRDQCLYWNKRYLRRKPWHPEDGLIAKTFLYFLIRKQILKFHNRTDTTIYTQYGETSFGFSWILWLCLVLPNSKVIIVSAWIRTQIWVK